MTDFFLEKANVALVPGIAFGCENHLRLSFATSMDNLKSALERMQHAIEAHGK